MVLSQAFYKLFKTVDSINFVRTVCDDRDSCAGCDTHGKNAKQAFCAYAAVVFLYPNGTLEGVSFLDEKRCGSCVKANTIFYCYVA